MSRRPSRDGQRPSPPPFGEISSALRIVEGFLLSDRSLEEVAAAEGITAQVVAFRLIALQAATDVVLNRICPVAW